MAERVEVYKDADSRFRRWRWRHIAGNNRTVGNPGQGFTRRASAVRSAKRNCPGVDVKVIS